MVKFSRYFLPLSSMDHQHLKIRTKATFNSNVVSLQLEPSIKYEDLVLRLRASWNLADAQLFTIKWLDDEGDLCVLSTQLELDEAIRLYNLNEEGSLALHVFSGRPSEPGMLCPGEHKIYRRGARRWYQFKRKLKRMKGRRPRVPVESGPQEAVNASEGDLHVSQQESQSNSETNGGPCIGLKDFELIKCIGRGSYAKVLLVKLKTTQKLYAMKIIKKELINDEEDVDWVQTEKNVFETASNYPFLVGLHSCFQSASRLFFVIEYVNGGDLMFHMQRQRRLPEEHARFYSAEIILALHFLHEKGIIYRDLKLDNVLLDSEGHIKLTDYGMCKEGIRKGDSTGTFCGTPNYIAPEILRGEDYDFSVDWWALGVLMFEMMAGRSPFDIVGMPDNTEQNTEEYLFQVILEKVIRIPRSLSHPASNVLRGFLNKVPTDRLGCGHEDAFRDILDHKFFAPINWEELLNKQINPPYKPYLTDDLGLDNFDAQFTEEPVQLTPTDPSVIARVDQSEFEGFEYINPLLMSHEDAV